MSKTNNTFWGIEDEEELDAVMDTVIILQCQGCKNKLKDALSRYMLLNLKDDQGNDLPPVPSQILCESCFNRKMTCNCSNKLTVKVPVCGKQYNICKNCFAKVASSEDDIKNCKHF